MAPGLRSLVLAGAGLLVLAFTVVLGQWLGGRFVAGGDRPDIVTLAAEAGCSPVARDCAAGRGATRLQFGIPGRPGPMAPFGLRVRTAGFDAETVNVAFEMPGMDMGLNRYRLVQDAQTPGLWVGKASLPVCGSGRLDWVARVSATRGDTTYVAVFPFQLQGS